MAEEDGPAAALELLGLGSLLGLALARVPMAPPAFAKSLRRRVGDGTLSFTAEADVELVVGMYEKGFVSVFEAYREFDPDGFFAAYAGLEWGDPEAKAVAAALSYAGKHCAARSGVSVRLEGNSFGEDGRQAIERAVRGARKLFEGVIF